MDTAEAITLLRQKLDTKQSALAEMLGVTVTSISRYENGRKPSREVLRKLADIAERAGFNDLRDIFTIKWRAGIKARLKRLRSAGTERAVALDDLKRWMDATQIIGEHVREALNIYRHVAVRASDRQKFGNANRMLGDLANGFLPRVSAGIETYINIPSKRGNR